nr:MAG TPA: hypothetical protein [Caudoviricetes sp.]
MYQKYIVPVLGVVIRLLLLVKGAQINAVYWIGINHYLLG